VSDLPCLRRSARGAARSFPASNLNESANSSPLPGGVACRLADVRFIQTASEGCAIRQRHFEGDLTHQANTARLSSNLNGNGLADARRQDWRVVGTASLPAQLRRPAANLGPSPCWQDKAHKLPNNEGEGTAMLEIITTSAGRSLFFATAAWRPSRAWRKISATCAPTVATSSLKILLTMMSRHFRTGDCGRRSTMSAPMERFFFLRRHSGSFDRGNSGTWEGDFLDGGPATSGRGGRLHNSAAAHLQYRSSGSSPGISLFWSTPWVGAANDFDVYVTDSSGNGCCALPPPPKRLALPYETFNTNASVTAS